MAAARQVAASPLEEWLVRYTFPLEARYADSVFAERVYTSLVDTLLANGTTTAVYYATVHPESTMRLADICLAKGQRAFVGKVAMDDPEQCPDYYRDESADAAIAGTRDLIAYVRALPGNENALVRPMITPRFIPSCTDLLLEGLGALAGESGCFVQTHCSEGDWEHAFVLERYGRTDTRSLDDFGLLRPRHHPRPRGPPERRGHGSDWAGRCRNLPLPALELLLLERGVPAPCRSQKGLRVGLGTDISGGASASILDTCRHAVNASRALEDGVDPALDASVRGRPDSRVDFRTAFWLATAGGADALDLPVGRFEPGCSFDAMLVDARRPGSNLMIWPDADTLEDVLQKIIYNAGPEDIRRVWVQGHLVADK